MPEAFNSCVKSGGRVKRITPKRGTYINVCYPQGGGSPVRGEVHSSSLSSGQGERRAGNPRTDAERMSRHKSRFGTSDLPRRGTGLLAKASRMD